MTVAGSERRQRLGGLSVKDPPVGSTPQDKPLPFENYFPNRNTATASSRADQRNWSIAVTFSSR